jgi:cytosine deaminase
MRTLPAMTDPFLRAALDEARLGLFEGGIPIGSVLVIDGKIVGRGHNRRVQKGSAILHAEMDCLENAGRLKAGDYQRATLYSTLSPCDMCSGTALLYKIPRIVIGENTTFRGPEEYVRSRGVQLTIVDDAECRELMREFIHQRPELWNEDIGIPGTHPTNVVLPASTRETWVELELCRAAQIALLGHLPDSLREVSVDAIGPTILFRAAFRPGASDEDRETLSVVAAEIIAAFPAPFVIDEEYIDVQNGVPTASLRYLVFCRGSG